MGGDIDSDGDTDLIVGTSAGISVLMNNGDGTFATKVDYAASSGSRSIAIGDVNTDNKLDVLVPDSGTNAMKVLINNGDGTFANAVSYACTSNCLGAALGDFDKDGDIDTVGANWSASNVSVLMNNGDGTFASPIAYGVRANPRKITVADFNHDTYPDMAITNDGAAYISVLINNGDGTFATKVDYITNANGAGYTRGVVAADVNGDSYHDLLVATQSSFSVLINNGNGTFASEVAYSNSSSNEDVAASDVDGDGDIDGIVTSSSGTALGAKIYKNNGSGTFSAGETASTPGGSSSQMSYVGDLDNDSYIDIAVVSEAASGVYVFINATGTQWKIDPQGTRVLANLDIRDIYNINTSPIVTEGLNIVNSGNNTGFYTAPVVVTATPSVVNRQIGPLGGSGVASVPQKFFKEEFSQKDQNKDKVNTNSKTNVLNYENIVIQKSFTQGQSSKEVKTIQQILNLDPDTQVAKKGQGSPGKETTKYGPATKTAVGKFQIKYGILKSEKDPGYGVVGPKTKAKMNEIMKKGK